MTTIPIFFTFDHHFVLAAGVAFHTLLEKADARYHYNLYVVHTDLKPHHMKRLQHVVGRFPNAEVAFIDASEYDTGWAGLRHKSHFSKEIFYKLTAADLFPQYDRILFSDVDVILPTTLPRPTSFSPMKSSIMPARAPFRKTTTCRATAPTSHRKRYKPSASMKFRLASC